MITSQDWGLDLVRTTGGTNATRDGSSSTIDVSRLFRCQDDLSNECLIVVTRQRNQHS
jgi:hypothetical protein